MAAHFLNTPQTDAIDRTRATMIDFSEVPTFVAPTGNDDLLRAVRSRDPSTYAPLRTPSARQPLGGRPNPSAQKEFTPLLKSALKKKSGFFASNTPALARQLFPFSSPALPDLPERSVLAESQMSSVDQSSMAIPHSSSEMGTPLPTIPARGELGLNNGNILSLKEQEAKIEQVLKDNFGLKLKIHFLEENLNKSGTEYNRDTIKQNTELRTNQVLLHQEIKKYLKQLKLHEDQIENYRNQLEDYKLKVQARHASEVMEDEIENYRNLAEERERGLDATRQKLESAQDQIEDLKDDVRKLQRAIEEKDDQMHEIENQLLIARDADGSEKDDKIEAQEEEIEQLQQELRELRQKRQEYEDNQKDIDLLEREHAAELEKVNDKLDDERRQFKDHLHIFESKLNSFKREKETDHENFQRKMQTLQDDKASEIETLEARLKLAQSEGGNQYQSAQRAVADAQERLKLVGLEKDAEIEELQLQLEQHRGQQDEIDLLRRQRQLAAEDIERLQQELERKNEDAAVMREKLAEKSRDIRSLKSPSKAQSSADQTERLQRVVSDRTNKIVDLQQIIETQVAALEELDHVKDRYIKSEKQATDLSDQVRSLQAEIAGRDRQIKTLRKSLQDRAAEVNTLDITANESGTKLGGLQSIIRQRDQALVELKNLIIKQEKDLEKSQRLAEERLKLLDELKESSANEKQDLQDEIEVLESHLEETETEIAGLLKAQELADADRIATHDTIAKLRADLKLAKASIQVFDDHSPLPKGTSAELKALRAEHSELQRRAATTATELRDLSEQKNKLRAQVREQQANLDALQINKARQMQAGVSKAQQAREETGILAQRVAELEKKHAAELRGMVKQIKALRARVEREKGIKGDLAFQKRWFLMMMSMYDSCNANNIRMIEEMGISPSSDSTRMHRPTLKSVAQALVFCSRVKRATAKWAEQKNLQETLTRKMEAVAKARVRRNMIT